MNLIDVLTWKRHYKVRHAWKNHKNLSFFP